LANGWIVLSSNSPSTVKNDCVCKWNEASEIKEKSGKGYTQVEDREAGSTVGSGSETMCCNDEILIDANLPDNHRMEFLFVSNKRYVTQQDGIVVTGIMVRCLSENPILMPESQWWLRWVNMIICEKDPSSVATSTAQDYLRNRYVINR